MIPAVSVVLVSYRSRDVLGACLDSLAAARAEIGLEVIVVDNASADGSTAWLRDTYPWVSAIEAGENRGYGAGVNLGVASSHAASILVLNPDSVVPVGAIAELHAALAASPRDAIAAPVLVDEHGRVARSCGRFPTLWTLACDHLGIAALFPGIAALCGSKLTHAELAGTRSVDWASGAALLIRRAAWDRVGPFDEAIFLYMEEVDWCLRAAQEGWRTRYVATARFVHLGQRSSRQVARSSYLHNLRSRVHYMAKHHGAFAAGATRAILSASMAAKWLVALLTPGRAATAGTYAAGFRVVAPWAADPVRATLPLLAGATLALAAFAFGGGHVTHPAGGGDGAAHAATAEWASMPRAAGPTRLAYFYEYMPYAHVDSLAAAGFDGAIIHSLADSTDARGAARLAGFRARGVATGMDIVPQWIAQQPARLLALGGSRRYTWGTGRIEPEIACPLDAAWWRSAFLDRAEEILAADPLTRSIAVDLEFHRGSLHHYDAGPCRCPACLAEYLGPRRAGEVVDPAHLRGLLGWQEARVAEILGALADTLAARHPGLEVGVFDLDLDSFVHRGFARALAACGLPVADYCERSYSTGAGALGDARMRLDALGLSRARLVGGLWLKRFAPVAAAQAAADIRARTDGHFIFTTYSLWLDPRELSGPYTLAGAPGDYWRAFRKVQATP